MATFFEHFQNLTQRTVCTMYPVLILTLLYSYGETFCDFSLGGGCSGWKGAFFFALLCSTCICYLRGKQIRVYI